MDMEVTISLAVFGVLLFAFGNLRSRRPYVPGKLPLISDTALQFLGVLLVSVMAAHLITLVTGKPFSGRSGF